MDQGFFVTACQLSVAIIAFIITIAGETFAITRFIYKSDGKLKLLVQRSDHYRDELSKYREEVLKLTGLFREAGFDLFRQGLKSGQNK